MAPESAQNMALLALNRDFLQHKTAQITVTQKLMKMDQRKIDWKQQSKHVSQQEKHRWTSNQGQQLSCISGLGNADSKPLCTTAGPCLSGTQLSIIHLYCADMSKHLLCKQPIAIEWNCLFCDYTAVIWETFDVTLHHGLAGLRILGPADIVPWSGFANSWSHSRTTHFHKESGSNTACQCFLFIFSSQHRFLPSASCYLIQ